MLKRIGDITFNVTDFLVNIVDDFIIFTHYISSSIFNKLIRNKHKESEEKYYDSWFDSRAVNHDDGDWFN